MPIGKYGFKKARDYPLYIRFMLYGGPFTGKTTAAMTMPNTLFFGVERGVAGIASTGPRHQGTGKLLDGYHEPLGVNEVETGHEFFNTIFNMDKDGAFSDPDSMLDGASCFCIDGINIAQQMFTYEYDKFTGRLSTVNSDKAMFSSTPYKVFEWARNKRPMNVIMTNLARAKMHVIYTSHSAIVFDDKDGSLKPTGQRKPKASEAVSHHIDVLIQMLHHVDDIKLLPKGLSEKDRFGWFIVHKDRYGVFTDGPIGTHAYKDLSIPAYIHAAKANRKMRGETPVLQDAPVDAMTTMDHRTGTKVATDMKTKIEFCMSNKRIIELGELLHISTDKIANIAESKYNGDVFAVITALETKLEKTKGG